MTKAIDWDGASVPAMTKSGPLGRAMQRIASAWRQHRTRMILAELDDGTLRDIGLTPSALGRARGGLTDWVVQSRAGGARIVFIGR